MEKKNFDLTSEKTNHFPYSIDDHYPVSRLDIRKDRGFATAYGYPKIVFKREPDTDPDIRNAFIDIARIQTFGKSCTLHNLSFIIFIQKHIFSLLCHDSESVCGVISVLYSDVVETVTSETETWINLRDETETLS